MLKLKNNKEKLYQWSSDIKVDIGSDENVESVEFCDNFTKKALRVEIHDGNWCYIPNILLQTSYDILAYVVVKDDNGTYTTYEETLEVEPRPKPSDYIYTETELVSISDLVDKAIEENLGNIESALDSILTIQESYIEEASV